MYALYDLLLDVTLLIKNLQVYRKIIDPELEFAFNTSFGMTLEHSIHKDYDAYKWTLFPKVATQSKWLLC